MRQMLLNKNRRKGCSKLFLGVIGYEQHFDELAASGGFPPFGAYGTTFPPLKRWDNKAP